MLWVLNSYSKYQCVNQTLLMVLCSLSASHFLPQLDHYVQYMICMTCVTDQLSLYLSLSLPLPPFPGPPWKPEGDQRSAEHLLLNTVPLPDTISCSVTLVVNSVAILDVHAYVQAYSPELCINVQGSQCMQFTYMHISENVDRIQYM